MNLPEKIHDRERLHNKGLYTVTILLFMAFGFVLIRTAWLCDDAYITFRTVDNFINGHGLTWNVAERVQAYTHPLWMFLLAAIYYFTHEIYSTSIFLSLFLSLTAVYLVAFRMASGETAALLGLSIFIFSRAFVDYSTSGLENPLTHLLLVIFLLFYIRSETIDFRKLFLLSFVAALGMLNRMDTFLFFFPPLAYLLWQQRSVKGFLALGLGFLPFLLWECFSLFYYGFFFPNTAYAKLNTGIAAKELLVQGLYYLRDSLHQDPITLPVILVGMVAPLVVKKWKLLPVSIGVLFYILYIVKIGGDFMSGRFLTAPLIVGVCLLSFICWRVKSAVPAIGAICVVSFLSPGPLPILSGADFGAEYTGEQKRIDFQNFFKKTHGVTNERRFYYPDTGLLHALQSKKGKQWPYGWMLEGEKWKAKGKTIYIIDSIGFLGFFAGSSLHIIDPPALADPLLARLPIGRAENWRVGHYVRIIPNGYIETLYSNRNNICDENLALYYDKLSLITRGDLSAPRRLVEIWNMNAGNYDHLIDPLKYSRIDVTHNDKGLTGYSVEELLSLVESNPDDVYAQYKLGFAYVQKGMVDQAIEHWEIAVKLDPNDRCMQRDLAKAQGIKR